MPYQIFPKASCPPQVHMVTKFYLMMSFYNDDLRANKSLTTACHRRRLPIALPQGAIRYFELDAQLSSGSAAQAAVHMFGQELLLSSHPYLYLCARFNHNRPVED